MNFPTWIAFILITKNRRKSQPWVFKFGRRPFSTRMHSRNWILDFWPAAGAWSSLMLHQVRSPQSKPMFYQFACSAPPPDIFPLCWRCDIWMTPSGRRSVVVAESWRCDSLWEPAQVTLIKVMVRHTSLGQRGNVSKQTGFFPLTPLFLPRQRLWNGQKLGPRISAWTDSVTRPISKYDSVNAVTEILRRWRYSIFCWFSEDRNKITTYDTHISYFILYLFLFF